MLHISCCTQSDKVRKRDCKCFKLKVYFFKCGTSESISHRACIHPIKSNSQLKFKAVIVLLLSNQFAAVQIETHYPLIPSLPIEPGSVPLSALQYHPVIHPHCSLLIVGMLSGIFLFFFLLSVFFPLAQNPPLIEELLRTPHTPLHRRRLRRSVSFLSVCHASILFYTATLVHHLHLHQTLPQSPFGPAEPLQSQQSAEGISFVYGQGHVFTTDLTQTFSQINAVDAAMLEPDIAKDKQPRLNFALPIKVVIDQSGNQSRCLFVVCTCALHRC